MTSRHLLARLGGAQPVILRETPGDAIRYSTMGAVLVGTAAVAAISAAFALNTAVQLPAVPAMVIGALWGLLILNLDRALIVSMARRSGIWGNVSAALPRLLLALLIGVVISVPLVLRIFQPEINNELQVMHSENLIANQKKLDAQFADLQTMQAKFDRLQRDANGQAEPGISDDPDVKAAEVAVQAARAAYDKAFGDAQCELIGKCGTGNPGPGGAFERVDGKAREALATLNAAEDKLRQARDAAQRRVTAAAAAAQAELKTLGPALQQRKDDRVTAQRRLEAGESDNTGLLARLEALDRLSDGRPMMLLAHWALILLFTCIELLPVLAKLLSGAGASTLYDQLVDRREAGVLDVDKIRADGQLEIVELRADVRRQLERDRAAAQVQAGKRANARLVVKQQEIADRAIDVWAQVADRRTDDELARWYARHVRSTVAGPAPPTWPIPAQSNPAQSNPAQPTPANGQPRVPQPPPPVGP